MEPTLNIFTLNCWGIPVISKNRKERIEAVGKYLSEANHNIVCLQEIWSETDYLYLKDVVQNNLPYSHYFYSGVLGSGLCIFSKWVIEDIFFHQWPLNGYIHKIHHGDWFGGKGVGFCRIRFYNKLVNVYCTHLHAEYHEDDMYLAHRVLQAHSTAELVNITSAPSDISLVAGDLNTAPGELSYRLISQLPSLEDPYNLTSADTDSSISKPSGTCDNINNSYSNAKVVLSCPQGKRIDHILFHVSPAWKAQILNFGNPLKERVPGKPFSYSDHNAVSLELRLVKNNDINQSERNYHKDEELFETISRAIKVCEDAITNVSKSRKMFLLIGGLLFMFLIGFESFLPRNILYDMLKIALTGLCFYYFIMGTLWNRIELNSLKAGLSALNNYKNSKIVDG